MRITYDSSGRKISAYKEGIENFWAWFGDGVLKTPHGEPMVFYHGTGSDITSFQVSKAHDKEGRRLGLGLGKGKLYFGTQIAAEGYAQESIRRKLGKHPNVMPVYLNLKKPITEDEYKGRFEKLSGGIPSYSSELGQYERDSLIARLDREIRKDGYDGIIEVYESAPGVLVIGQVAVFNPLNIKSAIGNSGLFDPRSKCLTDKYENLELGWTRLDLEQLEASSLKLKRPTQVNHLMGPK